MQQAYRVLRVVAEAQTIRIVLTINPSEALLGELCTACATLNTESSNGVKAVVLDFQANTDTKDTEQFIVPDTSLIEQACTAVRAVEQPVLAVVRGGTLSAAACTLVRAGDLTLVAHDAVLHIHTPTGDDTFTGKQALRLGYVTWSVPTHSLDSEMERILDMMRKNSAIALRYTKASVRLGAVAPQQPSDATKHLEALQAVNELYLTKVMQTDDASEGLRAFLEKRKPEWNNR